MQAEYVIEGDGPAAPFTRDQSRELASQLPAGTDVAVHARDRVAFVLTLLAAEHTQCRVLAAPSYWTDEQFSQLLGRRAAARVVHQDGSASVEVEACGTAPDGSPPGIVIFTSGSTGRAKGVDHSWSSAAASGEFMSGRLRHKTWYLAYEPASYAGLQVFFAASQAAGRLVIPPCGIGFPEHARLIAKHRIEVLSATPSWWRLLMAAWPEGSAPPRLAQATLGGEIVDQGTLDRVRTFFQPQHLTHVYATTEAGTAIAVSDGQAGFPARFLDDGQRRVGLRLCEGVLYVRSPFRMRGYIQAPREAREGEWIRTGDLVEVHDGRCFFVGREDLQLNIGGLKVRPEEVEAALRRVPEVGDCLVYARSSPIIGVLLAADIVCAADTHIDAVSLQERLKETLLPHKIPRHFRFVTELTVAPSGKAQRH